MSHNETVRIRPGANVAVLFMHGICATPDNFRSMLPLEEMVPQNWSVYNMVLDGHCGTVKDFSRSSMKKWRAQADAVFRALAAQHEKILLVGHSMGTLLALELAMRYPQKVAHLFLLAVPIRVFVKPVAIKNLLRMGLGCVDMSDPVQRSMVQACGMRLTKKLWKYVPWAPRMVELLRRGYIVGKALPAIGVPTVVWQSSNDEMVSQRSAVLLRKRTCAQVDILPASTHFYYPPEAVQTVQNSFANILQLHL
ncbi:MAG: alpha/beta fold hydrolase [Ruminococcaceae bacterium]|nr:alpha/beta fold hydrolase [Oscillospiraceae bacterium]